MTVSLRRNGHPGSSRPSLPPITPPHTPQYRGTGRRHEGQGLFYEVSCLACILYITTFLLQRQQVHRLHNRSDCSLLFVQFGISLIHTCFSETPRWAEFAFYFLQETTVENGRKRFFCWVTDLPCEDACGIILCRPLWIQQKQQQRPQQ